MDYIYIEVKKGEDKKPFREPRSTALLSILKKINEANISLEEAEEKANVEKGIILKAIETNDMLAAMDGYKLDNSLSKK